MKWRLRYTEAETRRLREAMHKVELAILSTAPAVYNALLSLPTYPRLPLLPLALSYGSKQTGLIYNW